jgi:hypothetical protein
VEVRTLLEEIDAEAPDDAQAEAAVAWLAAEELADDLMGPVRRALLLLAAGGDPHRPIDTDARAVRALADELDPAAVARALATLGTAAAGLPRAGAAAASLTADPERARRLVALAILAREIE